MKFQFALLLLALATSLGRAQVDQALAGEPDSTAAAATRTVDFARDIQPLLSDRCFTCHGPDAAQRASDLRLDQQTSAHELAIVPGHADKSELIRRILSEDVDELMPPPDSNLRLTDVEKELLQQWVTQGAQYSAHWAFVAPTRPQVPVVKQAQWPRGELDRFVLAMLEGAGLTPSDIADPETLIRRVSLDLTGLPPAPVEIDAFLRDYEKQPDIAYEALVDRLLASERFGERMAVDWLDVARYADTYGYQNDRYRPMWAWRDWVVKAFNQNLPYDQFITWQIAGDLLPGATRDQILATAFNRNHRQTNEGGSVEEEFRAEYVADRVNTFGAAFLGLTLECCRCHDHKYDPLTQREYYQLSAFFNSIDEAGLYSHFTQATPTPTLLLSTEAEREESADAHRAIAAQEALLASWRPDTNAFQTWRESLTDVKQVKQTGTQLRGSLREQLEKSLRKDLIADYPLDSMQDGRLQNRVDMAWSGKTSEDPLLVAGQVAKGLQLSGENNVELKAGGDFTRDQPFTISLWLKAPQPVPRAVVLHRSRAWTDSASRGYELLLENGHLSAALVHFWPGNAMRVITRESLKLDRWNHVAVRYDGSSHASGLNVFVNGEPADVDVVRDNLTKHIHGSEGFAGGDATELVFGQRFRDVGFKDGHIDELKVFTRDLSDLELRYLVLKDAAPDNIAEVLHNISEPLLEDYFARQAPTRQEHVAALRKLRAKRTELCDPISEIMVMRESPQPRPTHILARGAYDAPGELVQRGLPASIFPRDLPADATRADLASWLVDPAHPLTARVAINRFWQSLFGLGLVSTSEDFGLQGVAPSSPELLNWLCVEFVESGWDVKRLMKLMVMSAAYRQNSNPTPKLLERDPENRLLARGPSGRLPAEVIRDSALSSGALLVEKLGGPPVKPYQPEGLWEEKSGLAYERDEADGSHRRSLYTYWKRTSPPPAMMTLDSSNREVCVVRRQVTMTPLQALVLLNDPQYVEAARGLAERALKSDSEPKLIASYIFRALTSRRPSQPELDVLLAMYAEQRKLFEQQEEEVEAWLAIGDHRADLGIDPLELAAWSVVASGLMNFDETVMKR